MNKSGKLKASNDLLIYVLLQDSRYKIEKNGDIWTTVQRTGKNSVNNTWRLLSHYCKNSKRGGKPYRIIRYNSKHLLVHRIIYAKFIGELIDDLVINHKDGNTLNNSVDNLELVTQSQNVKHSYTDLKRVVNTGARKIEIDTVKQIRKDHKEGLGYGKLAKKYNIAKSTIAYIVQRKTYADIGD